MDAFYEQESLGGYVSRCPETGAVHRAACYINIVLLFAPFCATGESSLFLLCRFLLEKGDRNTPTNEA
jgi:hypothetical protein